MTELADKSRSTSKAQVLPHFLSCLTELILAAAIVKIHLLRNIQKVRSHDQAIRSSINNELWKAIINTVIQVSNHPLPRRGK